MYEMALRDGHAARDRVSRILNELALPRDDRLRAESRRRDWRHREMPSVAFVAIDFDGRAV